MSSVNKVIIIGRLGRDPEVRYTPGGKAVANFSLATTFKSKGEEQTEWHRVVAWDKTAEICEKYLTKGKQVYIEGRLQTRKWEKEGSPMYTTEIICEKMTMLGGKSDEHQKSSGYESQDAGDTVEEHERKNNFDPEIPF